jgi:hypothetical protein
MPFTMLNSPDMKKSPGEFYLLQTLHHSRARPFTKALTATDRAHALLPYDLEIETNRSR